MTYCMTAYAVVLEFGIYFNKMDGVENHCDEFHRRHLGLKVAIQFL